MAPKTKFDRESLINAAYEIARIDGFDAITARSVAKKLDSSVAPIYVNFKTIDELKQAVVNKVFDISNKLLDSAEGGSYFEKVGKASLDFAVKYPVFFRELVLKPNRYMSSYEDTEKVILDAMGDDEDLKELDLKQRRMLLLKMRMFQLGLSAMAANDNIPSWIDKKDFGTLLFDTGAELIDAAKKRKGGREK